MYTSGADAQAQNAVKQQPDADRDEPMVPEDNGGLLMGGGDQGRPPRAAEKSGEDQLMKSAVAAGSGTTGAAKPTTMGRSRGDGQTRDFKC